MPRSGHDEREAFAPIDPAGSPHPDAFSCDPDPGAPVETIQTHISHLFLTPTRVYKLRKPVRLPFLDFSTRALRNADCEDEVRLNRRLAPDVYLGIAAIESTPSGWRIGPPREGLTPGVDGQPAPEHCVVMRRLAEADNAQQRLLEDRLHGEEIDSIADRIADFHRSASLGRPAPLEPGEWIEHARAPVIACLEVAPGSVIEEKRLLALRERVDRVLATRAQDFEARRLAGRLVEGHGDLQLQHFFLESDRERPSAIDCVEFDPALRKIDGASDIAFTSMDLRYRGHPQLAERLLARYARERDDFHLYRVIDYYESYRSAVRSRVAAIAAADVSIEADQRCSAATSAEDHLRLAELLLLDDPKAGQMIVICGGIGSGKSRMAEVLADRLSAVTVSSDRTRKHLAGVAAADHSGGGDLRELYSAEQSDRVYAGILERADSVLHSGRTAILDARFATRARRAEMLHFAERRGLSPLLVEMRCAPELTHERLAARARKGVDPSDAGPERLAWSIAEFEACDEWPRESHLLVDSEAPDSLERAADQVVEHLDEPSPGAK